jgi:hypothetical protein
MDFYERSLIDRMDEELKLNACNKAFKRITIDGEIRTPYLKDCTRYYECDSSNHVIVKSCELNTIFDGNHNQCVAGTECPSYIKKLMK